MRFSSGGRRLFCLVLFCLGFGGFCIFPSKMGQGAVFGIFYHRFLRLCHQNWPHAQPLCPPSRGMTGQHRLPTVLTGICPPLGHHDHPGALVVLVWAVRPPEGPLELKSGDEESFQEGPACLSAPPFPLPLSFPSWVPFFPYDSCLQVCPIVLFCP